MDPNSLANIDEIQTTSFHLDLTVDFDKRILYGFVDLSFVTLQSNVESIILDTTELHVLKTLVNGEPIEFTYKERNPALGNALQINIPNYPINTTIKVRLEYQTSNQSSAIQFLSKEQTADKQYPYLFTQCQAIHARSLFPCQDCPSIRATYAAQIHVPKWATALMSALSNGSYFNQANDLITYKFEQPNAIPSYLVAIVVGKLEKRTIGPRSDIWSEPSVVELAQEEFSETEEFIKIAEDITKQEYVWKRYDIVCLPPSFPYGGMENPCLTFVTPTLLAGDKSLAIVVAHEIAHSWTGNLITNHTWEHFWLNEGWTVFLERKITSTIKKSPALFDLMAMIGLRDLKESVETFGIDHNYTCLVPNIKGVDPDDSFSSVPYEKGFNFLYFLATCVDFANFDLFFQEYINYFRYKTIDTLKFCGFFLSFFGTSHSKFPSFQTRTTITLNGEQKENIESIDWDKWLHCPGMLPVTPSFDMSLAEESTRLAAKWTSLDISDCSSNDINGWTAIQIALLLEQLLKFIEDHKTPFAISTVEKMESYYHFNETRNSEIRFRWCTLGIRCHYPSILPYTVNFLKEQGRMKFIRPLYRELKQSGSFGIQTAIATFQEHGNCYHPIAQKMIAKDLQLSKEE